MTPYQISTWFCRDCAWIWKKLSAKLEEEDQCPDCNSLRCQKIIKLSDIKSLGIKP
jgi:hypothetical protein